MFYWRLLSNEQLVEMYENARKASLEDQLIEVMLEELKSRGINLIFPPMGNEDLRSFV